MRHLFGFILLFLTYTVVAQPKYQVLKNINDSNSIVLKVQSIPELEVSSRGPLSNLKSSSGGISIDVTELKRLPNMIGDADPFKALQYLGGMSQAGEASANINVRGGDNDQNLIFLNGSQVENPTHVLGLFSIFNPDLIDQMQYIKSGIPAEFGGRLSSVIDIKNFVNTPSKLEIDGNVGLIASRLSFKSAISKDFSVYASHRMSYLGSVVMPMLVSFGIDPALSENKFEFSDTNVGFNYRMNTSTQLSGHFYTGMDIIAVAGNERFLFDDNSSQWGNRVWGLQLTHIFSERFSMTHSLNSTRFNLHAAFGWLTMPYQINSEKSALSLKSDFLYLLGKHKLKTGLDLSAGKLLPFAIEKELTDSSTTATNYKQSTDAAMYFRDEWESGPLLLNIGLRAGIQLRHPDSKRSQPFSYYDNKALQCLYAGLEPRIFGRWMLTNASSLKLSATKHFQYSNRVQLFNLGVPLELFVYTSKAIPPASSWHFSGGYFRSLAKNNWELSMEAYYKSFSNLLEFGGNLNNFFADGEIESSLLTGRGYAYGTEFMLKKNSGKFSGWVNYTLAWNYRQFDAINNGVPFLATHDRRHNVSLIGLYSINKKLILSAKFVYATGSRLNLPRSWYLVDEKVILEFSQHNAFKMPDYHRLDVALNYQLPTWGQLQSEINFSLYNLYNRANPFELYYNTVNENGQFDYSIEMSYLLPILPSVSWIFHL